MTSVGTQTFQTMVDDAEAGSTIILKKGTYQVEGTLRINKALTIQAESGCAVEDVVITGTAPVDKKGVLMEITKNVKLLGLTVRHMGGSPTMTLSTGVGSVCINIKEEGFLHIEDCEVTTETSAAIVANGRGARLYCDSCTVGPCGWDCDSVSGYGICVFAGGYGEVLNTDVWRVSQSGIVAFFPDSVCTAMLCDIGPSQLVAVSAEGGNSRFLARKCTLTDSEWKHCAEYDGGEVTLDQCTLDTRSKLGEASNVVDCAFV